MQSGSDAAEGALAAHADRVFGAERARSGLYEALCTTRAVRRLRPDPIPDAVLERVLRAATCAPTGGNAQPWRVLVLRDPARKRALAAHFAPTWEIYSSPAREAMQRLTDDKRARGAKVMNAGDHLAAHFGEAPAVLVFFHDPRLLGDAVRDAEQPTFLHGGSLYPAIQNLLLACRAEGLGGVLTTMIWRREREVLALLDVPEPWRLHAVVPIGYPLGAGHGPLARKPVATMAYHERWGEPFRMHER